MANYRTKFPIPSICARNYFLYVLFAEQSHFSFPWEAAAWDFHLQTRERPGEPPKASGYKRNAT